MVTKYEIINDMLLYNDQAHWRLQLHEHPWAFCVHATIMKHFEKVCHNLNIINAESEIFEYELQIGEKCYDMRIIIVPPGNDKKVKFLHKFIKNSQFSFPWEDNLTLFINVGSSNMLQQFIIDHNLQSSILKIVETPGLTANDEMIKVVTFKQSVNELIIIEKYKNYLSSIVTYHQPDYYYMTFAFPWLQPLFLDHFKIPIDDDFYSTFFIILDHLGTLNYATQLNIFDLLMLRLALCDYRDPLPSSLVKYEIELMVNRELAKHVKNHHLDLDQYLIDRNYALRDLLFYSLVCEFQHLFETVKNTPDMVFFPRLRETKIRSTIELVREINVLGILKEKRNIEYDIDGSSYDRMSLSLFLDLVECDNVREIVLDINHTLLIDVCQLNRSISNRLGTIAIHLMGKNTCNFIETFISSLKTIKFLRGRISLFIYCDLDDYRIFDNLSVVSRIEWNGIKIDTRMLEGLRESKLKSLIRVVNGTFENTRHNWALLNTIRKLQYVQINEDEGTWQSLFEFISDELLKTNSRTKALPKPNEYQFDNRIVVMSGGIMINLGLIKFTIDKLNSKVELRYIRNSEIIDLYDLKFGLVLDNKSDYEFYQ